MANFDHQENYLRAVLAYIGLTDVTFTSAKGLAFGDDAKAVAIATAKAEIESLAA